MINNVLAPANARYGFSGHETFPFRYAWIPKAIQKLPGHPDLFNREDAIVTLGVGKNMVKSIKHWCETMDLIEPFDRGRQARVTPLGNALFSPHGWDPYLEDPATLWLLHWLLVSKPERATTWYFAFTKFSAEYFTRDTLVDWLLKTVPMDNGARVTIASLRRDVEVFLKTYCPSPSTREVPLEDTFECPLVELGLLKEIERGHFQFIRGPKPSLPDAIFVYALSDFWQRSVPHLQTLSFEKILHEGGSPGGVLKLSENALGERLERLPRWTGLSFDETAGTRNVLRQNMRAEFNLLPILARHYGRRPQEPRV